MFAGFGDRGTSVCSFWRKSAMWRVPESPKYPTYVRTSRERDFESLRALSGILGYSRVFSGILEIFPDLSGTYT